MMMKKNVTDGLFASTLSDEEFEELSHMTKRELAKLYVDEQVAADIIGEPADRADAEAYVARNFRKIELIDGIVMLRGMDELDGEDDEDTDTSVIGGVAFRNWLNSDTPVAMTLEESDDMRSDSKWDDDEDDWGDEIPEPRSFTEAWCFPQDEDRSGVLTDETMRDLNHLITSSPDDFEAEYDDLRLDFGDMWTPDEIEAYIQENFADTSDEWSDEDEDALREQGSLLAREFDDDDVVDEWTEWMVLAGELERIDGGRGKADATWAWCPDHRGEISGTDHPMLSMTDAKALFDSYDPLGLWFAKRHAEVLRGEDPQLWRRMEVDLVCQTCVRYGESGLVAVRDDSVRLSKTFDIDGDVAARTLIESILPHI